VNTALPANAKITALVCSGRRRPKVVQGRPRLAGHHASCRAMPAYINGPEVYAMLRRAVRGAVAHHLEIEVVEVDGEPRLLTVDFELQEAS
jgi:hypothetical protein